MLAILANVLILVDSSHDFQEGEDGHVGHVPILRSEPDLVNRLLQLELLGIRELPSEQEAVSKVPIG